MCTYSTGGVVGTYTLINKASDLANDSSVTGFSVKDALNNLLPALTEVNRQLNVANKTANYSMVAATDYMIYADGTSNTVDIKAPNPVGNEGKEYVIKAKDITFDVRVIPYGSETFDGEANINFVTDKQSVTIKALGGNWIIK